MIPFDPGLPRRRHVQAADRLARRPKAPTLEAAVGPASATQAPANPAIASSAPVVAPTELDVAAHRGAMLRFARRKVRDDDLAEDAVQDALAAALANRESFQGQSALRTWLIGILNHKIQDTFRREGRYVAVASGDEDESESLLDRIAYHQEPDYDDPMRQVTRRQLGDALHSEIDALPATLKDVFVLQVLEGAETADVCRQLSITEANCWVRLHRARKRLSERMRDHLV
ncbi:MAG TPA: sigma-70 family RNA polymerase sigma factor [Burkholderiaceae bacterium]|nr:sigma-70 family RNA polymerase sigma factor [Burkholderiaceae bacterium]